MHNQPLSSSDQGKLLIFALLLTPSIIFIVGIVPAIFLAFGIFMMKKNADFSSVETAVKNFKGYAWLAFFGFLLGSVYWGYEYFREEEKWRNYDEFFAVFIAYSLICIAYLLAVQFLFFKPLMRHREWIVINGIFTSKPKLTDISSASLDIDIIKGGQLRSYSVADELIKWAKLKEEGHISEQEFNEARSKLLGKA